MSNYTPQGYEGKYDPPSTPEDLRSWVADQLLPFEANNWRNAHRTFSISDPIEEKEVYELAESPLIEPYQKLSDDESPFETWEETMDIVREFNTSYTSSRAEVQITIDNKVSNGRGEEAPKAYPDIILIKAVPSINAEDAVDAEEIEASGIADGYTVENYRDITAIAGIM